jgi:hypothetical protein
MSLYSKIIASASITRLANTTAYDIYDVIGSSATAATNILTLQSGIIGGSGYIESIKLLTDYAAFLSQIRVWFYNSNNITVAADNAPLPLIYSQADYLIGYIDLPVMKAEIGASNDVAYTFWTGAIPYQNLYTTNMYAVLQHRGGSTTPASGQKFSLRVTFDVAK